MRRTISELARFARSIEKDRYLKLSFKKQHELLAALAWDALASRDFPGFFDRYNLLQSWSEIDRYTPPDWLSEKEALHEYFLFHNSFGIIPLDPHKDLQNQHDISDSPSWQPRHDITVVIDQVRSPYNVGSILRTIDNFGFKGLVHNSSWLRIDHPQLRKAARGCEQWIPVEYIENLSSWLNEQDVPVIGIEKDQRAVSLKDFVPPEKCVLIVGSEAYGIASGLRKQCDQLVMIPMSGFKNSMNVTQALAVVAYKFIEKPGTVINF